MSRRCRGRLPPTDAGALGRDLAMARSDEPVHGLVAWSSPCARCSRTWRSGVVALLLGDRPASSTTRLDFIDDAMLALAYVVMALGLNIVVGFAGLLDLGYVAFYAFGAYTVGWLASGFFADIERRRRVCTSRRRARLDLPGIHFNFLLIVIGGPRSARWRGCSSACPPCACAATTSRSSRWPSARSSAASPSTATRSQLRRATKLDQRPPGRSRRSTRSTCRSSSAVRPALDLRPWYWFALALVAIVLFVNFRLRDSRLGRAWIAIREDEVAAASMGVPLVKTKLLAYAHRRGVRRRGRRLPRLLPQHGQRRPVPVRVLDLHPGHGHPGRPGLDLGRA